MMSTFRRPLVWRRFAVGGLLTAFLALAGCGSTEDHPPVLGDDDGGVPAHTSGSGSGSGSGGSGGTSQTTGGAETSPDGGSVGNAGSSAGSAGAGNAGTSTIPGSAGSASITD